MNQNDTHSIQELHAIVRGLVQGVGFRDFVVRNASVLRLRGYTRNDDSGDVEVVAQGPRPALERLLALLHRGPSAADVSEVQVTWRNPTERFSRFNIRW